MDFGFVTHSVHANSRLVWLRTTIATDGSLTIEGPPDGKVYPPGPGWLHVLEDGVPSRGVKVMVGSGEGPPVDQEALDQYAFSFPGCFFSS